MTFKYAKLRILVTALLLIVLVYAIDGLRNGFELPEFTLWKLAIGLLLLGIAIWATGGTHLLTKYKIDDNGLTIHRKFQPDLFIAFKDIKTLRLLKTPSNPNQITGGFEIRYRPKGVFTVPLEHLKLNKEFVHRMNAGYERANATTAVT